MSKSISPRSKEFNPWHDLEYHEDFTVQDIVKKHPDGMTLEQVGSALGITRERVRQIEVAALYKMKTGEGAGEYIEVDGYTFAIVYCEKCNEPFPRRGRKRYCPDCEDSSLTMITIDPVLPQEPSQIAARRAVDITGIRTRKKRKVPVQVDTNRIQREIEGVVASLLGF
jgi:Zn finger protein HypA/HybF involved in hydrogenase expression